MKNYIIGSGFLSNNLKKSLKNCEIIKISNYKKIKEIKKEKKINFIINSFYKRDELNNIENYEFFVKKTIYDLSKFLDLIKYYKINKIIFTSSAAVYSSLNEYVIKSDKFNRHIYSCAKIACESLIKNFCSKRKIQFNICRVFNMYGEGDNFSIINKILKANKKNKIYINNKGESIRDYINVKDVVFCYSKLLKSKKTSILDVGTGIGYKLSDLIQILKVNPQYIKFNKKVLEEKSESVASFQSSNEIFLPHNFIDVKKYLLSKIGKKILNTSNKKIQHINYRLFKLIG